MSDPMSTIPKTIELLKNFGSFSGYKLNFAKSKCFPVNNLALEIPDGHFPFKMSRNGFKYLGVHICRKLSALYKANFPPLINKLKSDLERWNDLHIAGRVNCVKMNVLPRFLYLFQSLPIFLPNSFFCILNKLISSFIWKGKTPRIKREFLQRHKSVGGLSFPNLKHYYWAANIHKVTLWIQEPDLIWCKSEADSCSTSLLDLLTSKLPYRPSQFTCSPIVISTLRIWSQFRNTCGLQGLSNHSPIHYNHLFLPPSTDVAFSLWKRSGLSRLKDLYVGDVFASFSELCEKFNLPRSHLFRYFQIRNFVKSNSASFPNAPPDSIIDSILDIPTNQKGLISKIYILISHLGESSFDKIKRDWEEQLGKAIDDRVWDSALTRVNNSTSCSRLNLMQFKVVHSIYFTNSKLSKIYPNITDTYQQTWCICFGLVPVCWFTGLLFLNMLLRH